MENPITNISFKKLNMDNKSFSLIALLDLRYFKIRYYPDSDSGTVIVVVVGFFKQDLKDCDLFGRFTVGVNLNGGKKIVFLC